MAAITVSGIYRKKFLNKNKLITAVAIAVINAALVAVAHDLIFNAVLTNTAVVGAIPKNHPTTFVIPNPRTSCSLSNHSLVILAAIFAETMVSTTAIIAITKAVLSNHGSTHARSRVRRWSSCVGKANNENCNSGYLSRNKVNPSRQKCEPRSQIPAPTTVAISTQGNEGTNLFRTRRKASIAHPTPTVTQSRDAI